MAIDQSAQSGFDVTDLCRMTRASFSSACTVHWLDTLRAFLSGFALVVLSGDGEFVSHRNRKVCNILATNSHVRTLALCGRDDVKMMRSIPIGVPIHTNRERGIWKSAPIGYYYEPRQRMSMGNCVRIAECEGVRRGLDRSKMCEADQCNSLVRCKRVRLVLIACAAACASAVFSLPEGYGGECQRNHYLTFGTLSDMWYLSWLFVWLIEHTREC